MDTGRLAQVRDLFDAAGALPAGERSTYLAHHCPDDEVRAEVESLLAAHQRAEEFLSTPVMGRITLSALQPEESARGPDPLLGCTLGRYRIVSVVGVGGMGVVYRAEQENPQRTVALKVIRSGAPTQQLLRRFEHEAEALGRLRHPAIAQIYEAGAAPGPDGRLLPYFAMEFVDGKPLLEFAGARDLNIRARLELIALVCDGVQHAHQRGVIHRDLKPSNILVEETERPRDAETKQGESGTSSLRNFVSSSLSAGPRILDFGVARFTEQEAGATLNTSTGQIVGTLPYMSPEQVRGEAGRIDTRTDVYSLGVILYELLTGTLPYDVRNKPITQAATIIAGEEPGAPGRHDTRLKGDIATILLKTLEKEPDRRYPSAADLASDIRRYLTDEPIAARPATTMYQLSKFARRNKALVGGVAATIVVLALGVVGTSVGLVRARAAQRLEQDRAEEARVAARTAERTGEFLTTILAAADPEEGGSKNTTIVEALDRAGERINVDLADEPEVRLKSLYTLGRTCARLGLYDKAERHMNDALALVRTRQPGGSLPEAEIERELADALVSHRQTDRGIELSRHALALAQGLLGADNPRLGEWHSILGAALGVSGNFDEAFEQLSTAAAFLEREPGHNARSYANTLMMLASARGRKGGPGAVEETEALFVRALEANQRATGPNSVGVASVRHNYANFLYQQRRLADAEKRYREALAVRERELGPDHSRTLATMNQLAMTLSSMGSWDEAARMQHRVVDGFRRTLGETNAEVCSALTNLSETERLRGDLVTAERLAREAVEIARKVNKSATAAALRALAGVLRTANRNEEAIPVYEEAVRLRRATPGSPNALALLLRDYGAVLIQSDPSRARALLAEAVAIFDQTSPGTTTQARAWRSLARALVRLEKPEEAEAYLRKAAASYIAANDAEAPAVLEEHATLLDSLGRGDEAAAVRATIPPPPPAEANTNGEAAIAPKP